MASMTTRIEHLKNEIKTRQDELKKLEDELDSAKRKAAVRPLDDVTVEEKVKFFDACYKGAIEDLEYARVNGCSDDNSDHYSWEYAMETLAWPNSQKDFWDYYNSFIR